ncbi:histone-lysine N-methyltransferase SETMAR [Trichonephila clavipes]|nr:histone-lysine N-methyltransferase SETMAR [Trichonephila clavipes]
MASISSILPTFLGAQERGRGLLRTLRKLRRALQNKRHGMLSEGILLIHKNARPHTFQMTWNLTESFGWEVLDHTQYSPNLSPSDFHLFLKPQTQSWREVFQWQRRSERGRGILAVRPGSRFL